MWIPATHSEDNDIVAMSRELYAEDPAPLPVPEQHTRETLSTLRAEPARGRALVLQLNDAVAGYALLISFWSNELGGEIIVIDELYVRPPYRNQGYARALLTALTRTDTLWPRPAVAIELEVTPQNKRAAALYSSLGFQPVKNARLRFLRI
jgi:ribosomal protein S18 acetylase RimI-like enzyme